MESANTAWEISKSSLGICQDSRRSAIENQAVEYL